MSHTTSTDGPYFSSGPISWSQLKNTFRSSASGSNIRASDFIRYTNVNLTNPDVTDCTENNAVVSSSASGSNWRASHFRNTIRFYYVTQYGLNVSTSPADTDINLLTRDGSGTTDDGSNGGRRWNGNLPKNIKKYYNLTGTCGSNNSAWPAQRALGTVYNLEMTIRGSVLGAGGVGGTGGINPTNPATEGGAGGIALLVQTSGSRISITFVSGARVYGGGGGGAGGGVGPDGTPGRCTASTSTSGCGGAPGCPSPYTSTGTRGGGGCAYVSYCCGFFCCGCTRPTNSIQIRDCVYDQPSTTPLGGNGGAGAKGRGYDNQSGSLAGSGGSAGSCPSCSFGTLSGGTCGDTGRTGGNGGDWGTNGGNALRQNPSLTVNGGRAGNSISGSNYFITSNSASGVLVGPT